jgi:hypothetical protein
LVVILLAVLIQPFALALVLTREPPPEPRVDEARVARALEGLNAELERLRSDASGDPEARGEDPRDAAFADLVRQLRLALASPQMALPGDGAEVAPGAEETYGRGQVDSLIRRLTEQKERGDRPAPSLFFHRTMSDVLRTFGVPDETNTAWGDVQWIYRNSDGGEVRFDFVYGRVSRFWFDD